MNEEEENEMLAKLGKEFAAIDGETQFVELNFLAVSRDTKVALCSILGFAAKETMKL